MRALTMAAVAVSIALTAGAQNRRMSHDGTTEFTSRGGIPGANNATIWQRIPADQLCGVNTIVQFVSVLQDQNIATVENVTWELRGSDPLQATGAPDVNAGSGGPGLIASAGPFALAFPGAGPIAAAGWTITFAPNIILSALPVPLPSTVPNGDLYLGNQLPANPLWPNDGVSCHISTTSGVVNPGEQMNQITNNTYTLIPNQAGLAWVQDTTTPGLPISQSAPNRAYLLTIRTVEDQLQGMAENAVAFTGLNTGQNANYGYAGIFPWIDRLDAAMMPIQADNVGWRVRATAPVGYTSILLLGLGTLPPFQIGGVGGSLCLDLNTLVFDIPTSSVLLASTTQATATHPLSPLGFPAEPATTTEAIFAQLFGLLPHGSGAGLTGLNVYAQAFTFDPVTGIGNLSTLNTTKF